MIFRSAGRAKRLSQDSSLRAARDRGLPVACVIDVGVQKKTDFLIKTCADAPHLLFEPVRAFFPEIRRNYQGIDYELFELALSDEDGIGLLETGSHNGGEISHAWISRKGEAVRLARLDTVIKQVGRVGPFLLKIDVDGADAPAKIIDGASGVMKDVSCVVCEMVRDRFLDLAGRIARHGFELWDIVDCAYYDDIFYQCDAIFIRRDLIASNNRLKPFSMNSFDPRKWWSSGD